MNYGYPAHLRYVDHEPAPCGGPLILPAQGRLSLPDPALLLCAKCKAIVRGEPSECQRATSAALASGFGLWAHQAAPRSLDVVDLATCDRDALVAVYSGRKVTEDTRKRLMAMGLMNTHQERALTDLGRTLADRLCVSCEQEILIDIGAPDPAAQQRLAERKVKRK